MLAIYLFDYCKLIDKFLVNLQEAKTTIVAKQILSIRRMEYYKFVKV